MKQGYKQTEIGVIPEDWECVSLNNACTFIGGGTPSKNVPQFWNGNIPWISSSDIIGGDIYNININRHITEKAIKLSATHKCPKNTILVVSRVGVGKVAISDCEVCTSQDFTNLIPKLHDPLFLTYALVPIMENKATESQGTSIKGVTTENIKQTIVIFPSLPEQERIAKALSDVDNMIISLEKLIAKKKAIKQGAMQEFLTGKKRLPGFTGEWSTINLSNKSKIKARIGWQGLTTNEYLDSGFAYLVTGTDFDNGKIAWDGCHYVAKDRFDQDKNIQIQNDDILITKDGSLGKTALVKSLNKPATLNSGVFLIRPIQGAYDPAYVYYILSSFVFKNFLDHLSAGSTIIHLYQKDISKFEFAAPPTIEEQTAIAAILSDMDNEIEALEEKLEKTRQVKQGMMQQLLTGKIRLISETTGTAPVEVTAKPQHNHQFDDAVVIAAIVNAFYTNKFPLGRKKVQKLLYLLRRKQDTDTSAFKKKAAGPYADEIRYKGGEPIAVRCKYIATKKGEKGTTFVKGDKIASALDYIEKWEMGDDIDWLVSTFRYTKTNDLELYATIDMAICDLTNAGEEISVASIKKLIASNGEWKAKLSKSYFTDSDIERAIRFCQSIFNQGMK